MRTILSFLLFPVILLAQKDFQHENAPPNMEFQMDFTTESSLDEEITIEGVLNGALELFITVEIYVWEVEINRGIFYSLLHEGRKETLVPKYLNTFSLVGLLPMEQEDFGAQQRLNRLLALNDPLFMKEDALFNWLNPIKHKPNYQVGVAGIPEGFGPRIKI